MSNKPNIYLALALITTIISAAFVVNATATSNRPPAQPTAIAIVDIVDVIGGLDERSVLEAELQAKMETRQQQLDEIVKKIQALETDVQELPEGTAQQREKLRELVEHRAVAQARREALSQIVSIDMGIVRAGLYTKVEAAIAEIAEREGYDIVLFDDSEFPLPENAADADIYRAIINKSVIYRHDSIDITSQVITLMNNQFSAP